MPWLYLLRGVVKLALQGLGAHGLLRPDSILPCSVLLLLSLLLSPWPPSLLSRQLWSLLAAAAALLLSLASCLLYSRLASTRLFACLQASYAPGSSYVAEIEFISEVGAELAVYGGCGSWHWLVAVAGWALPRK